MKIHTSQAKCFQPIEIRIQVDSIEELAILYASLNTNTHGLCDQAPSDECRAVLQNYKRIGSTPQKLYEAIHIVAKENGL